MSVVNFYKHYLGDYGRKTAHLSLIQEGAYRRMLDHYYGTMKPLPQDSASLCRISRAFSKDEQEAVQFIAEQFFSIGRDGLLHNKRADEEISKWTAQAEVNRITGRLGGRPKTESVSESGTEQEPSPEARSQKPDTIDQNQKKRGASRFSPPALDEVKAYCADRKNQVNPETFVDFYAAKGWKVGNQPMKDWKAAVRTWEKREQFTPKNGNGSVPPITDERGLESYGAKFGIRPRAGESWQQFRSRVVQAAP